MELFRTNTLMVLRLISILLILVSFTVSSTVEARRANANFKKAQVYFKKKQYTRSLKSLRRGYNFKRTRSIPASALFLIGLNYQKLGKHKESIWFFNKLIKNVYARKHVRVIRALKKDAVDDVKIPRTLNSTYFYLAQNHYAIFAKTDRIANAKKAKTFFRICDDSDFNDKCSDFLENITERINFNKKKRESYEFFVYAGRILFQDKITLENNSGGDSSSLLGNNSGLCYGAGLRKGNSFKGYQVSGCLFSGTAIVSDDGNGVNYAQSGVPVAGIMVEAGKYYKPDEDIRLGISLPIMYRAGSYSAPSDYSIKDSKSFTYGAMLTAGMQLPIFEFQTKFAHLGTNNLLMLNLVYNF